MVKFAKVAAAVCHRSCLVEMTVRLNLAAFVAKAGFSRPPLVRSLSERANAARAGGDRRAQVKVKALCVISAIAEYSPGFRTHFPKPLGHWCR